MGLALLDRACWELPEQASFRDRAANQQHAPVMHDHGSGD
jgi:hypothetical protein